MRDAWLSKRAGLETYTGRIVRPEDNGDVAADKLVPPCPANRQPRRGVDGAMVTQYEFARAGIVSRAQLKSARRYAIVAAFVVAAVLTPPDIGSQLLLAIPLCILYELGLIGIWFSERRQSRELAAADPSAAE